MTSKGPTVSDEARGRVGTEIAHERSDPVSRRHILEYLAGIGDDQGLACAKAAPREELTAPPLFVFAPFRRIFAETDLCADGQYPDLGVAGVAGRSVAGSDELELSAPVRVGDVLDKRVVLASIEEKTGRSGRLVFVTSEATITNQHGALVATTRATVIFR